jgi:quercetin dioxygenase-like cupin family protein
MNGKFDPRAQTELTQSPSELIDMVGGRLELVARMGPEESDTVLFRTRMAPGKLVPLHSHSDPECFYVLSGRLDVFLLDDAPKWRSVEAGRSVLVANGVKHAVQNAAEEPLDLIVATNNRFANFLREAGRSVKPDEPFAPPTKEDIQRMIRIAQDYGYWNASPAESAAITDRVSPGTNSDRVR